MESKLVTVIIPLYNSKSYINKCLDSVINQTYKNIEIILVDDGSSDNTIEIAEEYGKNDSRIIIMKKDHIGVSHARNVGLKIGRGDYVIFIDQDDYVELNLIDEYIKSYRLESSENKDIVWSMVGMQFEDHCTRKYKKENHLLKCDYVYQEINQERIQELVWLKLFNFVTNKMYNYQLVRDNKVLFDENIHIAEDLNFNIDYLSNCKGIFILCNKPLYHYVKLSKQSLSLVYYKDSIDHTKVVFYRFLSYCRMNVNMSEDGILVIESNFILDWLSRMSALYENKNGEYNRKTKLKIIEEELRSNEFQEMLNRVHKSQKISPIRYYLLWFKKFKIYYNFRQVYQHFK